MEAVVRTQRRIVIGLVVLATLLVGLGYETPRLDHVALGFTVALAMFPGIVHARRLGHRSSLAWMAWSAALFVVFFATQADRSCHDFGVPWTYVPIALVVMAMFVGFLWLTTLCSHAHLLAKSQPDLPGARVR